MVIHSQEKQRAFNIIWNASGDYSFRPEFAVYDSQGRADLYWNFIIGAVRKYYDYSQLQSFFASLQKDPDPTFYEGLAWIGLENCTFAKGKQDRPVLADLRRSYANQVLQGGEPPSLYFLIDDIKRAHFQRALGEEPQTSEQVRDILADLEFDASLTTDQIIARMNRIIADYFPLRAAPRKRNFIKNIFPGIINLRSRENPFLQFSQAYFTTPLVSLFKANAAGTEESEGGGGKKGGNKIAARWQSYQQQQDKNQRDQIHNDFGASILSEARTKALEQLLCAGNHQNCHLHFTRGEFSAGAPTSRSKRRESACKQNERNKDYYKKHLARNNTSIAKLTHAIKNTILVNLEASQYRSKTGSLAAGKVWRSIYLSDEKVFIKNVRDDIGNLAVDILLDASGSQNDRQEMIATQGYIIAESLNRCQIPVRVQSFCTRKDFTVITLLRDGFEANQNERIFHYFASGCNRDGLAIRTAIHMLKESGCDHKILIVLSDGKPVDPHGIPAGGRDPDLNFYSDAVGVNDTAVEVRKGRQHGVSILCVFTGLDEDLPAAQKIYGTDMVRTRSPDQFADMVGVFLKNVLSGI